MEAGGIRVDTSLLKELRGVSRKALKDANARIEELAHEEHEARKRLLLGHLEVLSAEREQARSTKQDTKTLTKLVQLQRRELEKHGDSFRTSNPGAWRWLLFDRLGLQAPPRSLTKKGAQKLGKEEFKWLINEYPDVEVLRYAKEVRWHAKRLSTEYAIKIDSRGFTHPSYNIHTTSTTRIASGSDYADNAKKRASDAGNLQNIPEICRQIYVPDQEGGWFLSADWSQAQALIGFHLAGEQEACELIKRGDIHTRNARILADALGLKFGGSKEEAEALKGPSGRSLRHDAKPLSYGWLFGMGPWKMQQLYGGERKVWERVDAAAREAYPKVVEWWKQVRDEIAATGKLRNPWGLISYYYNSYPKATKAAKEKDFREAMGWLVQSCEAMMCLTVLTKLEKLWQTGLNQQQTNSCARLVTTTHDSFLLSFPQCPTEAEQQRVRELLEREWPEMGSSGTTTVLPPKEQDVSAGLRLKADLKLGQNWGPHSPSNPTGLCPV